MTTLSELVITVIAVTTVFSHSEHNMMETNESQHGDFLITDDEGVFFREERRGEVIHVPVCSPVQVMAMTRDPDENDWGKLLSVTDPQGGVKRYHMRSATLALQPQSVIADLVHMGMMLSPHPRARNLLVQYLRSVKSQRTILSSRKPGWVKSSFVLPSRFFGDEEVLYSGDYRDHGFGESGEWTRHVGRFCSGNSRLVFAASAAFAAPLLGVIEIEGGGFHFRGETSIGKSTALEVAASVYGPANRYVVNWDATKNSLEQVAEAHNDCLLVVDELGLADPGVVGETLYMLANGHGKSRMGQQKRRWRIMVLTSGEISLAEHMAEAGKSTRRGQEVRLLDIAADAGAGMGLFEKLHRFGSAAELATYLKTATRKHCGTPIVEFLSMATTSPVERWCRQYMDLFTAGVGNGVPRAVQRFAIVAAAGEIATNHGLTGWRQGEAIDAATKCYEVWMEHRKTYDPVAIAVDRVQRFIREHEERFESLEGPVLNDRVGYKKRSVYLILPDVFREIVCAGMKAEDVATALERAGFLNTSGKNRLKKQERIRGELCWLYSISEAIVVQEM